MTYTEKVIDYLRRTEPYRARRPDCAAQMGLSDTTLNRRLQDEGTSYGVLADADKRRRMFDTLHSNPAATCWELAEVCGLSCSQSAQRAFQRWTGLRSIAAYKQQLEVNRV